MSKIIEIESALNQINGDEFQEFCNHFLSLKLRPNSIDPIGSVLGKNKARKGTPDSCFTMDDDSLVFAEYTTKEKLEGNQSFMKKLTSDIDHCFNESKTSIAPDSISSIILCFTNKLKPIERIELKKLCATYNSSCNLQIYGIRDLANAVHIDYPQLGEYLGVGIGTNQILSPSQYISDYEKSKLSTPLSNSFVGRESEIDKGLNYLELDNILLVNGASGVGKSRFAIELCSKFVGIHDSYKFLCIGNNGIPIWDDLKIYIRNDANYILLVDDANRLAKNFEWILSLLKNNIEYNIKVVATVRDYAITHVEKIAKNYSYFQIEIKEFSTDDIERIISSEDFNIKNPAYIDRIKAISKGNARLAIMCSRVASETNNLLSLNDASQIYEEYFGSILDEVKILKDKNTLKILAVLSFFGKINKENRDFCEKLYSLLNVEETQFWEICSVLNDSEIVDLYENEIVKFSDQIFATYIFYKVVIDTELIDFKFFLDNYIEYEHRLKDTIIPIINTFSYKNIEAKIKVHVVNKWSEIQAEDTKQTLNYLDMFWFYLDAQMFLYSKNYIDNQLEPLIKEYRYSVESNEFSSGVEKIIDILSRYRYTDEASFKDALELLLYYGIKIPSKIPAIIYIVRSNLIFTRDSHANNNFIQHTFIDSLISKSKGEYDVDVYNKILFAVLPNLLKIEYRETVSDGSTFTIYTLNIGLSDSIKSFRRKCFDFIYNSKEKYKSNILTVIKELPVFDYKKDDKIYNFDKAYIFSIIDKHLSSESLEDCMVVQELLRRIDIAKLDYLVKFKTVFKNKLYDLTKLFEPIRLNSKKGLSLEEEEKLHEEELIEYVKCFGFHEYRKLFNDITIIRDMIGNIDWNYNWSINVILAYLANNDFELFVKVLKLYIENYKFDINFFYVFNCLFSRNSKCYYELFLAIKDANFNIKLCFHNSLITDFVSEVHLELLYDDLKETISKIENEYFFSHLSFIEKYAINSNELFVYDEIIDIVQSKIDKEEVRISVGEQFIVNYLKLDGFSFEKALSIYLYSDRFKDRFDYKRKIIKELVAINKNSLLDLIRFKYPKYISYHSIIDDDYDFIWELDNYTDILEMLIQFFLSNHGYYIGERAINAFFPKNIDKLGDKSYDFLKDFISKNAMNNECVKIAFNIVVNNIPSKRDVLLRDLISINSDFNLFKDLDFRKRSWSYSGSKIPHIEAYKKSWERVLDILNKMPNRLDFIEHKEYTNKQISYCETDKVQEMRSEFLDDWKFN